MERLRLHRERVNQGQGDNNGSWKERSNEGDGLRGRDGEMRGNGW